MRQGRARSPLPKATRFAEANLTVGATPVKDVEATVLPLVQADMLAERFKQNTMRLVALANVLATHGHRTSAEEVIDVIGMLKEVQTECEARKAVTIERRRAAVRRRRAARQATKARPESGSITEDEVDTTEGT